MPIPSHLHLRPNHRGPKRHPQKKEATNLTTMNPLQTTKPAPTRVTIFLNEFSEKENKKHPRVVRIVSDCGASGNLGSICLGSKKAGGGCSDAYHLDLAWRGVTPWLIDIIRKSKGDFRGHPNVVKDGALQIGAGPKAKRLPFQQVGEKSAATQKGSSACWSGSIYDSWRAYRKAEHAVAYLKRYFEVKACGTNELVTQEWIDECSSPDASELDEIANEPELITHERKRNAEISNSAPLVSEPPRSLPKAATEADILAELVRWIHSEPFQRQRRYAGRIFSVDTPSSVVGWDERILKYTYAKQTGPNFSDVYKTIGPIITKLKTMHHYGWSPKMSKSLISAEDLMQIEATAKEICDWGGVPQYDYSIAWEILRDAITGIDSSLFCD